MKEKEVGRGRVVPFPSKTLYWAELQRAEGCSVRRRGLRDKLIYQPLSPPAGYGGQAKVS